MMHQHLDDLFALLRIPSVSTDPARRDDLRRCAAWLAAKFTALGLTAEVHQTPGHPIVSARNRRVAGRRTVLIYGHYDVQPADPLALWRSDPFAPTLSDSGVITARGATDNKGQILAHILGAGATIAADGDLPLNVIFLVEGEEEIGSPHLAEFLRRQRAELACDVVAVSDTGMLAPGRGTLTYGLRGIACLEVTVSGPDKDLHSGIFGGAVANPLTVLARLLATLHAADGRVAIRGFYDGVAPLAQWERDAWAALPVTDAALLRLAGAPALAPEPGYSGVECAWGRPTAELNGLYGGYQGVGSKTVIPAAAHAKLSFRLVPGQEPEKILSLAAAHLRNHCPPGVTLTVTPGHAGAAYLLDPATPCAQAARRALALAFPGQEPALVREGGSIPIVSDFKKILGADTLLLGLALPDARIHSPNETFTVENFAAGIRLNQILLRELAR
ncbi:MAG: dipeptidase [Verrucomicrobiales bacterium]|jgi:acetylornithine deacetylase/succinyl-diaminopimelate desuccinylase-like protein|nr:dipeptidase [Verrucomicrobiales bacterium]